MRRTLVAAAALFAMSVGPALAAGSLADAVRQGDHDAAIEMLRKGADVSAAEPDGSTALLWAAHRGDTDLVKRLIKAGADVTVQNAYGATALSEAAIVGDAEMIKALLKAGADPNGTNPEGQTALMVVARTGAVDAARVLVEAGADVNARESWGAQSALMWAAAQQHPEMVEYLISAGADVNARGAVRNWQRKITSEPRPKDMNKGGFTPLLYAAREGCTECARYLVEAGADIDMADPDRVPPLSLAIINFQFDTAKYLIAAGADVNKWDLYGRTPLFNTVDMNTTPAGGRTDIPSRDATTGYDIAKLLLEKGANPDIQLKLRPPYRNVPFDRGGDSILSTGATPLLRAAKASDNPVVQLLIDHGATVDLPNADGVTPLMAAAGLGHGINPTRGRYKTEDQGVETLEILYKAGADINAIANPATKPANDDSVGTPRASFAGSPYAGRNAVHGAALKGWDNIIRFLAEHGADVSLVDSRGKTPYDLAAGNYKPGFLEAPPEPKPETMALLESFMAAQGKAQPGL